MIAFLFICVCWTVVSLPIALLIGAGIARADKPRAELTEPEAPELYVPGSWTA